MNTSQDAQTLSATTDNASKYRFNEAMINWEQLKIFGLSRENLETQSLCLYPEYDKRLKSA
jgi:hypothetical protein